MRPFTSRQAMVAALAAALLACVGGSGQKSEVEPAGYLGPTLELEAPGRGAMLGSALAGIGGSLRVTRRSVGFPRGA